MSRRPVGTDPAPTGLRATRPAGPSREPEPLEERIRAHALVETMGHYFPAVRLDRSELIRADVIRREMARAVDRANGAVPRAETVQDFRILAGTFTVGNGMLASALRVRRAEVTAEYRTVIDTMYASSDRPPVPGVGARY